MPTGTIKAATQATVDLAVSVSAGDLMSTAAPIASRRVAIASEIRIEMKRTVESVIRIGKLLLTAKELTADPECGIERPNPDARFGRWVAGNFPDTAMADQKTRFNFMNVARVYGDRDPAELENLGLSVPSIPITLARWLR